MGESREMLSSQKSVFMQPDLLQDKSEQGW